MTNNEHPVRHRPHVAPPHGAAGVAPAGSVKDPVCGMNVDPASSPASPRARWCHLLLLLCPLPREVQGRARALPGARRRSPAAGGGGDLHLPDAPGGAAGGARAPARSAAWRWSRSTSPPRPGPNPELADMTAPVLDRPGARRCLSSLLEMGGHLIGPASMARPADRPTGCSFVLATPVVLWAGWPFFVRGWQSLRDAATSTCSR